MLKIHLRVGETNLNFNFYMKRSTLILMMAFLVFGCQKEDNEIDPQPGSTTAVLAPVTAYKDVLAAEFSRKLALSLQDEGVRNFIKQKVTARFDGDFDILFAEAQGNPVAMTSGRKSGSTSFGNIIMSTAPGPATETNAGIEKGFLEKLLAANPLLQISMPVLPAISADEWNQETYIPLVVFMPSTFDEKNTTHLTAYDEQGNAILLDITTPPSQPILVVSQNERLLAVPKTGTANARVAMATSCLSTAEPYYEDTNNLYYFTEDAYCNEYILDGGGGSGGGSTGGGTASCDRDLNPGKDILYRAKFKTIDGFRDAEHYLDGNPEIYCLVTIGAKDPNAFNTLRKTIASPDRSKWKDCGVFTCKPEWFYINSEVVTWDKAEMGNRIKYTWIEEDDSNDTYEYTIGLSTSFKDETTGNTTTVNGQSKVTLKAEDKNMGESYVEYCDNTDSPGYEYDTGFLTFNIIQ
jgi:hypothetical protein